MGQQRDNSLQQVLRVVEMGHSHQEATKAFGGHTPHAQATRAGLARPVGCQ